MDIAKAKVQSEDGNWVKLTFNDDSAGQVSVNDGIKRKYTDLYNKWVTDGGEVEPLFTSEDLLIIEQSDFRASRDLLLIEADVEINKLDDVSSDSSKWRKYRQALRDSTIAWVLPKKPKG